LLYKLKIPSLIGFIVAGIIIGPQGVGLIKDTHFIQILAEIGVILLLFTIGIEFSLTKLVRIRKDSYTELRKPDIPKRHLFDKYEWLPEIELDGYRITENSHLSEKSIKELQIRKKTGATVIAVRRAQDIHTNPEPDFRLRAGDILLFTTDRENMHKAIEFFKEKP